MPVQLWQSERHTQVIDGKDKQIQNLTELYESTLAELQEERRKSRAGRIISLDSKKV